MYHRGPQRRDDPDGEVLKVTAEEYVPAMDADLDQEIYRPYSLELYSILVTCTDGEAKGTPMGNGGEGVATGWV